MADEPLWNDIAAHWWREQLDNKRPGRSHRVALAHLRRCTSPVQAVAVPEALDLARRIGITRARHDQFETVLLTAIVLAHVREDDQSASVARQLGTGPGQRAAMSPLRFAQLLNAETTEEKLIAFRRAVALLRGAAHVSDLAFALLDWSEKTRIAWAFKYCGAPPSGPAAHVAPA
jgi:CRISPR system Cascade subunit CasB